MNRRIETRRTSDAKDAGRIRSLAPVVVSVVLVALGGMAGCSGSDPSTGGAASTTPAATTPTPDNTTIEPPKLCMSAGGGACINRLTSGTAYTTTRLTLTYSVPDAGWNNIEDLPGNFGLLPPGNTPDGVNAGTSDFLGVYTSIAASHFADAAGVCNPQRVLGVEATPTAITSWILRQPELTASTPQKVSVGGLSGLKTDVRVAKGAKLPSCTDGGNTVTVFLLYSGVGVSDLDHGVIDGMTMRLYLLDYKSGTLCIELTDVDAAPTTMKTLSTVADLLTFRL